MQTETNTTTSSPSAKQMPPRKLSKRATKPVKALSDKRSLKSLCAPLKIDTKTARRVLRKAKLGFHTLGNRWELTDSQAARVREVLKAYRAT